MKSPPKKHNMSPRRKLHTQYMGMQPFLPKTIFISYVNACPIVDPASIGD